MVNFITLYFVLTMLVLCAIILLLLQARVSGVQNEKLQKLDEQSDLFNKEIANNQKQLLALQQTIACMQDYSHNALLQETDLADVKAYTRYPLLNVVLTAKEKQAGERGIAICGQVERDVLLPCNDVEMVSLFENLLDNAIEACDKLSKPYIRYEMTYTDDNPHPCHISVVNTKSIQCTPLVYQFEFCIAAATIKGI